MGIDIVGSRDACVPQVLGNNFGVKGEDKLYQEGGGKLYHRTMRCEYRSVVVFEDLGRVCCLMLVGLLALLESVAFPVHLQDVYPVSKAVQ